VNLHRQLPPTPEAAPAARAAVREWITHEADPFDQVDDVALVLTELVTNAVRHGQPPIELDASFAAGTVRLVVRDADPRGPQIVSQPGESGGYGLRIVEKLARWGWRRLPDGKVVWAEIPR
jgi:anti-sigma regulatory factor (Ser/Thr protein kinase)